MPLFGWPFRPSPVYLPLMIEPARSQGTQPNELTIPRDTARDAWEVQMTALRRLGPAGRAAAALDLSESVRAAQLAGIQAAHPDWSRADVVRHLVCVQLGVDLPREP